MQKWKSPAAGGAGSRTISGLGLPLSIASLARMRRRVKSRAGARASWIDVGLVPCNGRP